jgi:hypothetical protein
MNRWGIAIAVGIVSMGMAASQTEARPASVRKQVNGPLANGTSIHIALTKTINSNKLKDGEEVTARTVSAIKADGRTVIPSNALIEGRVTQSLARSNGDPYSALAIVFDKALVGHGEEIPLHVSVAAIALPQSSVMGPPAPATDSAPLGYGAPQGGASRLAGTPAVMPPSPPVVPDQLGTVETKHGQSVISTPDGLNTNGQLAPGSRGVYGLGGIGLSNQEMVDQGAALITSTGKKVHLASGTQFMLVTR